MRRNDTSVLGAASSPLGFVWGAFLETLHYFTTYFTIGYLKPLVAYLAPHHHDLLIIVVYLAPHHANSQSAQINQEIIQWLYTLLASTPKRTIWTSTSHGEWTWR